ncbi:MAG: ATP-dependent Clp protease ATP-binding subunit [Lachnospiraceae bacterium]|nr:ATP-dependent Clp protease ATP-binding subunit [Lachnospiraceae bacterium]
MENRYTDSAREVLEDAKLVSQNLLHSYVGTEHLLIGLVHTKGTAATILRENGVEEPKILELVRTLIAPNTVIESGGSDQFTPRAAKVLGQAEREAAATKSERIGTEHLLLALLKETDCVAVRLLNTMNINLQKVAVDILVSLGFSPTDAKNDVAAYIRGTQGGSATPTLDQYSRDLTAFAAEDALDPVIGRDSELARVIQILSRRTKNNPCLIGEPGVGKTAIVEALAQRIVSGNVPEMMLGKRVVSLDLSAMVAGSKYRGEFEERIKGVLRELTDVGNVLLFIDEIHTIIGAGGAEGAIDASNILKPSLARGEVQVIGATTREEYRKHIEKDAALERRFQPVEVEEPTQEEAIAILKGLRGHYEAHHHVTFTDEALEAAVRLSARYVNDRFLPDKAIDLMDEAGSRVHLQLYTASPHLKELEEQLAALSVRKEELLKSGRYAEAAQIRPEQESVRAQIEKARKKVQAARADVKAVGEDDIAAVVSQWTGVPAARMKEEEGKRLRNLEKVLHQRVIGQEEAVSAVSKAIRRSRVGLQDPNRPIGSFLFLGPTGVGKTELSKALAEAMFGDENAMIRVDMSEYMEKYSVSKFIGSPPGYVGYDDGGQLSEKIRRHPYSVVLFDEIEKAHPDVFNILLQVLDEGHITDAHGKKINFRNTIIIMTSNAGAQRIVAPKALGFGAGTDEKATYDRMKSQVMEEVKRIFRPEFINRIDEILVFHMLGKEEIAKIVKLQLSQVAKRLLAQMQIKLSVSQGVVDKLTDKYYDRIYGARPIRRGIQTDIEDALAEEILSGKIARGDQVSVKLVRGEIRFVVKDA